MRFCPFCSAENADELAVCQACGRRLPPLPPRRARNAPPTGVQLPPRPASSSVQPLPAAAPNHNASSIQPLPGPAQPPRSTLQGPPPTPGGTPAPRKTGTTAPPPIPGSQPNPVQPAPSVAAVATAADSRAQLLDALTPGPAAERSRPPQNESSPQIIADRRGRPDSMPPPMSTSALSRPKSPSAPPSAAPPVSPTAQTAAAPVRALHPPRPITPGLGHEDDFNTNLDAPIVDINSARVRSPTGLEPPPTRIQRSEALVDRPFTPQKLLPVPEIPEPGMITAAKYAYWFARARWQRRGAMKLLGVEIKQDTDALDQVLGALGRAARGARVEGRVFSAENSAINDAEERVAQFQKDHVEVEGRKAEENSKFVDVERERNEKLGEAERMLEEAQRELANLEAQRRALRDKRKELERRIKAYLKAADDHERQAGATAMGDQRQELRRAAEGHRKEAATLEPERQDIDRRLSALDRPINEATARLDAAKAELDSAKRSLNDAREGHTHRLAELDSEQKRKAREIALAESEIAKRLVTLGTLVNLNRIEDPQFGELYMRIDRLRTAITARTTEIEKLTAEREAYDRGTLVRGVATIGGAFVLLIALIVILRAIV
ncbi:MAG: Chromosome segregation ATPase-like protein [Myxococcales bacterium]|nr:Chromosome segregation ATPase-like protein [Myxococcales bacterium]